MKHRYVKKKYFFIRNSHHLMTSLQWYYRALQIKFVEVKTDSDKPSMKQIQWMHYLRDHDIDTEFCYLGANTTRQRCRTIKMHPEIKTEEWHLALHKRYSLRFLCYFFQKPEKAHNVFTKIKQNLVIYLSYFKKTSTTKPNNFCSLCLKIDNLWLIFYPRYLWKFKKSIQQVAF